MAKSMVCPNCGAKVPEGSAACPSCSVAIITVAKTSKKKWTVTDLLEAIPFIVIGALLLFIYGGQLIGSAGPAVAALSDPPTGHDLNSFAWSTNSSFAAAPLVLAALSHLTWMLGGLFLLIAGILALAAGKGMRQANAAAVFMLFGLVCDALANFILYYDYFESTVIPSSIGEVLGNTVWIWALQAAVILFVLILVGFKKRAKKKQKFEQTQQQAAALKAARQQAILTARQQAEAAAAKPAPKQQAPAAAPTQPPIQPPAQPQAVQQPAQPQPAPQLQAMQQPQPAPQPPQPAPQPAQQPVAQPQPAPQAPPAQAQAPAQPRQPVTFPEGQRPHWPPPKE